MMGALTNNISSTKEMTSTTMATTAASTTTTAPDPQSSMISSLAQFQLVLMILIALIGSFGNALVLVILSRKKHRSKTSSVLLFNLAVCDMLVSAICIPLDITLLIAEHWIFGTALCKVIYPLQTSLPIVSSYTLMFMLLERNMIFSSRIRSKLRSTTVKTLALVTWALSGAMVLPYAFKLRASGHGETASCGEHWSNDYYRKIYTVSLSVVEYLIPMVFIIHFVVRIVGWLRREQNLVKKGLLGLGRRTSKRRVRTQRRLAIIFIVMVVTYASLKLPNNIFWQWIEFGSSGFTRGTAVVHIFVGLCAYSTCATNPFILILMSSEFRKDIKKLFCICKIPLLSASDNSSDSERSVTMTMLQSSLGRTFSTKVRLTSNRGSRPNPDSIEAAGPPEQANDAKKKQSVAFQEPEEIPMGCLAADVLSEKMLMMKR